MNVVAAACVEKKDASDCHCLLPLPTRCTLLTLSPSPCLAQAGQCRTHASAGRNRDAAATCTEVKVAATWEGSTAAAAQAAAQAAACAAAQAAACTEEAKGIHPVAGEAGQDGGTGS